MRHQFKSYVRWGDMDAFNHVNNASYLVFMQEARADLIWYSRIANNLPPYLADMVVAKAEVDFKIPIYDGGFYVDVEVWVNRISNSSFEFTYQISSNHGPEHSILDAPVVHAIGKTVQVAVSMETKRSRRLRDDEKEFLLEYYEEDAK
jgi:acyl-CoA thioester hydrolase